LNLLVATSNAHKLDELRQIMAPAGIDVLSLADLRDDAGHPRSFPEPAEDADTFEGNARLKAVAYARMTGMTCLADDSGLEVDALRGAPGVHSAYYADWDPASGRDRRERRSATRAQQDARNNARLIAELRHVPESGRAARFVCAMCVAAPDGSIIAESRGTFDGRIGHEPRGANGFGYDPLLVLDDGRTSAELTPDEKNARSHRGTAARLILARIKP